MTADHETSQAIRALIEATYEGMSTPGSGVAQRFGDAEIAIAGSGQGELWSGPEEVGGAATAVSSWGYRWTPGTTTVWRRGYVAWAQNPGTVTVVRDGADGSARTQEVVPHWTTGVFGLEGETWNWLYWGESEPQESPKV